MCLCEYSRPSLASGAGPSWSPVAAPSAPIGGTAAVRAGGRLCSAVGSDVARALRDSAVPKVTCRTCTGRRLRPARAAPVWCTRSTRCAAVRLRLRTGATTFPWSRGRPANPAGPAPSALPSAALLLSMWSEPGFLMTSRRPSPSSYAARQRSMHEGGLAGRRPLFRQRWANSTRHAATHPHAEPPPRRMPTCPWRWPCADRAATGVVRLGTERPGSAAVPVVGSEGRPRSVDGEARCTAPVGAWDDRELLVRRARGLGEEVGGHKRMPAAAKGARNDGNETSRTRGPESMSRVEVGGETTNAHTPCHICAGTRLSPATSAPGPGPPLPHRRRDHPSHICTGTGLAPPTSSLGLGPPLSTSAPGLGSRFHLAPRPHARLGSAPLRPEASRRQGDPTGRRSVMGNRPKREPGRPAARRGHERR